MKEYDALRAPDPEWWLELDESERIGLVSDYHERLGIDLESLTLHAAFHAVVENQASMGDEVPVQQTLDRLMSEGLDRHEAVHAIGMVLMEHFHDVLHGRHEGKEDKNEVYFGELRELTAEKWRSSG